MAKPKLPNPLRKAMEEIAQRIVMEHNMYPDAHRNMKGIKKNGHSSV